MRQILLMCIIGMALYRITVAGSVGEPISELTLHLNLITEILEKRFSLFAETLHERLTSFENRLTQLECSKNCTAPNGGSPSFDYGSRESETGNKGMKPEENEKEEVSKNVQIPNGEDTIQSRLDDIENDLLKQKVNQDRNKSTDEDEDEAIKSIDSLIEIIQKMLDEEEEAEPGTTITDQTKSTGRSSNQPVTTDTSLLAEQYINWVKLQNKIKQELITDDTGTTDSTTTNTTDDAGK
ncbi:uncharacterized protein LOC128263550 [Drosophila gunungcola]|uniref:Uncharacterized protein n=1 Tax=Drosophila gunungcola TaxID=103775 RepID=A0A9P9YU24_9MUSC|nr:uncharacterized protein LOC128263550 [Drosophila gunungcola]KAI8042883.1 hypothetical protein M5D96_004206 [Drosophila gunungcola]